MEMLLILALLILLNGAFSMAEMAVVSSRKARLQQLADDERRGAAAALALANHPSNFLATIQVGITLIGITSGAFGEAKLSRGVAAWLAQWPALAEHADAIAVTLVVAGITVASLIVGELAPKRLALLNPEGIASLVARPMQLLAKVVHPLVRALSLATEGLLRLFGVKDTGSTPVSEEEIEVLMEQGAEAGVFEEHEQRLVSRIFRLDRMRVAGIMTAAHDVVALDLEGDAAQNVRRIAEHGHSRYPVVRGDLRHIEGIVHARDLLADALGGRPFEVSRHLAAALAVPASASATRLMELFRRERQTLAMVVDERGNTVGLVTLNDVLEALVGDIATVETEEEREIVPRGDGTWLIDGSVTIERVKMTLDIEELPGEREGAYQTLAGFIMEQLGQVPAVGQHFESAHWRWEVVDMDERRIDRVLAIPAPAPEPADSGSQDPARG